MTHSASSPSKDTGQWPTVPAAAAPAQAAASGDATRTDDWSAPTPHSVGQRTSVQKGPGPTVAPAAGRTSPNAAQQTTGTLPSGPGSAPDAEIRRGRASRSVRSAGPRRARLQLRHIDTWTVLKFSCVLSIALFFVWLITIGVLYGVLDAAGVIEKINSTVQTINGTGSKAPVTAGIVFGSAALIGAVNIFLFIALATIGSVVYNLCADLVGGIELTLSERET